MGVYRDFINIERGDSQIFLSGITVWELFLGDFTHGTAFFPSTLTVGEFILQHLKEQLREQLRVT